MLERVNPSLLLVGRLLLAPIFLLSGVMKILHWSETAEQMATHGMVAVPFFLVMAILIELGGGFSVLFGCKARLGALVLALFLIPATLVFHDFWNHEGPALQNQMQHFLKNVTIIGGLLTLVAAGAGPYALDALRFRKATTSEKAYAAASALMR